MNNLRTFPRSSCKNLPPYFFHGAFAPSFIWRRRPCISDNDMVEKNVSHILKTSNSVYTVTTFFGCLKPNCQSTLAVHKILTKIISQDLTTTLIRFKFLKCD